MESCETIGRRESPSTEQKCLAGLVKGSANLGRRKAFGGTRGHSSGQQARRSVRFSGVQQLILERWGMSQRLGALRRHVDVLEDVAHGGVLGNEGDDLHLRATEGT